MNRVLVRLVIGLLLLAAGSAAVAQAGGAREEGPGDGAAAEDLTVYRDPQRLLELIENPPADFHLVDARTPEEFASGHIPGSVNIDYRDLASSPPAEERDALIIVYCRTGRRSGIGVQVLEELGYTRVLNWGGVVHWPFELVR
ncbi:MAG: rhodanese-like domain-containing protein [Spirochaetota bacterium]